MVYRVIVMPDAKKELRQAAAYIRRDSAVAARRWFKRMNARIETLAKHPERCPLAPEAEVFDEPIRELLCGAGNRGTYRVLFAIVENTVAVLHVRHGSMLPLAPED